ncbi:MAG TPA: putative peptidoglycan glycosyltransferase FtsW [Candidatus Tyrphobacter sp.]|nr:putative peptidoglycan glycosyltransferase FtsW [Candidatus Tyrphobacter sp.]
MFKKQVDLIILISLILLVVFGLIELSSASSDLGKVVFNDAYYYLKHQIFYGLSFGVLGFLIGVLVPYKRYKKITPLLLIINLVFLLALFTPLGVSSGGAERWLKLGPIIFQPTELLKITLVLYLAAWFSNGRMNRRNFLEGFLPFIAIVGFIGLLLLFQHSTSAAVILTLAALAIYFVGGANPKYLAAIFASGFLVLALAVWLTPYRFARIATFLHPSENAQGSSYQINQSLISIGSGGFWGVGYGQSEIKRYLPARIDDSIFAVLAEEFGFVGSTFLIAAYLLLIIRGYLLARDTKDSFARLILVGFSTILGVQVFIHIGANTGLIPLTGVPLPFISYGGTSLAIFITMAGMMLGISKYA